MSLSCFKSLGQNWEAQEKNLHHLQRLRKAQEMFSWYTKPSCEQSHIRPDAIQGLIETLQMKIQIWNVKRYQTIKSVSRSYGRMDKGIWVVHLSSVRR